MSSVVSTKVVIGIEQSGAEETRATIGSATDAAKNAQRSFADLQAEQANAYTAVSDLNQESQQNLANLTESFTRLRAELGSLPDALKQAVDAVVSNLQRGDVAAANAVLPLLQAAPEPVRQQVEQAISTTLELNKTLPTAEVPRAMQQQEGGATPPPKSPRTPAAVDGPDDDRQPDRTTDKTPAQEPDRTTRRTAEREPEKPLPLLRAAYEALKDDDLETARSHQIKAARAAIAAEDTDSFALASELPSALRAAQEKENGLESARRFDKTMTRLEDRLRALEGATEDTDTDPAAGPTLGGRSALGRAARTLSGVDAHLEGGVRRASEFSDLEARLGRSQAYLNQAERSGAPDSQVVELRDQLEALTAALEKSRESYEKARQGGEADGGPRQPDGANPDALDTLKGLLAQEGQLIAGRGLGGMGSVGRVLGGLGAAGAVGSGVVVAAGALNWLENRTHEPAREGAMDYAADTDLARQYGIRYDGDAPGGDPVDLFRWRGSGYSYDDYIKQGYTASDASRVMSQLDLPNAGNAAPTLEDVKDILTMSRSTGLEEGRIANTARTLGTMTDLGRGELGNGLELFKGILTEGVKHGVSQSDTMQALVQLVDEGFRDGHAITERGLAFQAAMVAELAATGDRTFQGAAGAQIASGLQGMATGAGDPAHMALLHPMVQEMGVEALNLDPKKDAALLSAWRQNEREGNTFANTELFLDLAPTKAPETLAPLMQHFQDQGGSLDLIVNQLMKHGLSRTVATKIAATPGGAAQYLADAAEAAPTVGEGLDADPQGANVRNQRGNRLLALERDAQETAGYGMMGAFLDSATAVADAARAAGRAWRNFLNQGGRYGADNPRQGGEPTDPTPEGEDDASRTAPAPSLVEDHLRTIPTPGVQATYTPPQEAAPEPERAPPQPAPQPPRGSAEPTGDDADDFGHRAYARMAGGLEATTGDASNTRTSAFGFSQIMPENLLGHGAENGRGELVSGWDQAYLRTEGGQKWRGRLGRAGLIDPRDPNPDPIPDEVAALAGMGDTTALPDWYGSLSKRQRGTIDGFMQDVTQHQMSSYYRTAKDDGASHDEAKKRAMASWYGGSAWLDRDDPERSLSEDNPNYTRGHGVDAAEPSIQQYIERALQHGHFQNDPNASRGPQRMEVNVNVTGRGALEVSGLTAPAQQRAQTLLDEFLTVVSEPSSHRGFS